MSRISVSLDRSDHLRALLTECLPVEVPLFFSNDGFYRWQRDFLPDLRSTRNPNPGTSAYRALVREFAEGVIGTSEISPKRTPVSRPYRYEVRVSQSKSRHLCIVHPRNQLNWINLYRRYDKLMVHYCSRSNWSIRAPKRVGSFTYIDSHLRDQKRERLMSAGIDIANRDFVARHVESYFAYSGVARLHKFFSSEAFVSLEAKYPVLWMLDIQSCFPSIYTHSISWAMRSKEFVKRNLKSTPISMGDDFDKAFQSANWGETNGIVVGPEISRIFAELILQSVDLATDRELTNGDSKIQGLFAVRRYVDDYFVFATDELVAETVRSNIATQLESYNLHLSDSKVTKLKRPFVTARSAAIEAARGLLRDFATQTTVLRDVVSPVTLDPRQLKAEEAELLPHEGTLDVPQVRRVPRRIRSASRLKSSFLSRVRGICIGSPDGYGLVCGYLVPALARQVIDLCAVDEVASDDVSLYVESLVLHTDVLLFLYAVDPTVAHSVTLAGALLRLLECLRRKEFAHHLGRVEDLIFRRCTEFLRNWRVVRPPSAWPGLEFLNVVTLLGQLSADYEVPWDTLRGWVLPASPGDQPVDYFTAVVLLQYAGTRAERHDLVADVASLIDRRLEHCTTEDLKEHAELAMLAMDVLACPYVPTSKREEWASKLLPNQFRGQQVGKKHHAWTVRWMQSHPWFSDWRDVRLERSLARRLRTGVY